MSLWNKSRIGSGQRSPAVIATLACSLALLASLPRPALTAEVTHQTATADEDAAIDRAKTALDRWQGDDANLEEAKSVLDAVLATNPSSAPAYRQYARYYIILAPDRGTEFYPATMALAERALDRAIELSPGYAEAHVLRGHLYTLLGRRHDARSALHRAEALGTQDPWLHINWGNLLLDEGNANDAITRCDFGLEQTGSDAHPLGGVDECLIRAYKMLGRLDDADDTYRRQIARNPERAWPRGNHALFQLCRRDDPETAAETVTQALQRMDYGLGRSTLAAALYTVWAKQALAGHEADAELAWARAWSNAPTDPTEIVESMCGVRAGLTILRALRDTGRAAAMVPLQAVLLTADGPDHAISGQFVFEVAASGRKGENIYLNSESDYRDPRNLTVRFSAEARTAFHKLHGEDPDTAFKGKRIAVIGMAQRVKVHFLIDGMPSDKFYYQTHVNITEPWQVELETERTKPADGPPQIRV